MLEVIKPGLETTVQDWPGRIGYWEQGFPFSGPMDDWSFRLANLLVGNPEGAAGLECQFTGPALRFGRDSVVAVTGADMQPTLDNAPAPLWKSFAVRADQVLAFRFARLGARAYLAIAGGIDTPPVLGSRATFHQAGIGGLDGHALKAGRSLPLGDGPGTPGRRVREDCRPPLKAERVWQMEAVPGPNDDWIDEAGHRMFLESDWTVQSRSNRTGFRLTGPAWSFAEKGDRQALRAWRGPVQHPRPRLSGGRGQSLRPDPHHPGQRRTEHGGLHQPLYGAVCGVLEARPVEAGGRLSLPRRLRGRGAGPAPRDQPAHRRGEHRGGLSRRLRAPSAPRHVGCYWARRLISGDAAILPSLT